MTAYGPGAVDWDACPEQRLFAGVRSRRADTNGMTLVRYAFDPGAGYPDHSHPEEQVVVVLQGAVTFRVAGSELRLSVGDVLPTPGGVVHGATAGPEGALFLNVVVPRRPAAQG